jgi:hypothetical protein
LNFLLAFTRAGFDSQLPRIGLGLLLRGKGLLAVEVRPIQSNLCLFQVYKKTRAFGRSCTVSQDGAIGPIFEGDMPPKKMTPFSVRR